MRRYVHEGGLPALRTLRLDDLAPNMADLAPLRFRKGRHREWVPRFAQAPERVPRSPQQQEIEDPIRRVAIRVSIVDEGGDVLRCQPLVDEPLHGYRNTSVQPHQVLDVPGIEIRPQ